MNSSPYLNKPVSEWLEITNSLLVSHPLSIEEIVDSIHSAWNSVLATNVGHGITSMPLREINPPATVIGYFFEKLLAKEISKKYPGEWAGGVGSEQKDLHYIPNPRFSIEVKSSGQRGFKIFGNRSYGQTIENSEKAKKDKSGYYITINFHNQHINLIRFGWIDASDWKPQKSPTGQMAGLGDDVYNYKLIPLVGSYTLNAPIGMLSGVGKTMETTLSEIGIHTINDALLSEDKLTQKLKRVYTAAQEYNRKYGLK